MIKLETTSHPFSIAFKKNNQVMMTVRLDSDSKPNLRSDDSSVAAEFPRFTLDLKLVGDHWALSTTPADSPVEIKIQLPGWWYGGGELINQHHPLNRLMLHSAPFHTFDNGPTGLSGVMNPAWFSSNGALIIADSPFELGMNQPPADFPRFKWSFATDGRGAYSDRPFCDQGGQGDGLFTFKGNSLHLKFSFSDNAVTAYENQIRHFGHPIELPPEGLFTKPTWTTWARYKTAIHQEVVLKFADEIIQNGYPYHVMEIDDRWQVYYGDLEFDPQRFPDPQAMIAELHAKGFKVTAWVIPFLDERSNAFAEGTKNGWLVRRADGSPYLVPWWQGHGGLLDVTNPSALEWFFGRLNQLQVKTGADGFKFDAGEACFLPGDAVTYQKIHPNEYTKIYVDAVAKHYRLTEVRSGWRNQAAPIFFRQWDKTTSWGLDNGLHSVLTGALAMSLAGYPFILPDMVGGNEYDEKADADMMIRWTQLNALLPSMQFSLAPWDYGEDAAALCRRFARLHVEFAPKILEIARASIAKGQPIIRPIFWLDPSDERALICDDEFLLGDEFLAAPVVTPNTTQRDIYLPKGKWQNHWTGEILTGNTLLENYPTPLDTLPIFKRIK
ncbi:MAG: glycoside hydrolase [Chloroflexi bacterium]|nr:glycoside hydrolase [Chloroflexota bacterium]MDL1943546.1 glycoside hydrolase [Chloroflexi bacterium CFX2]